MKIKKTHLAFYLLLITWVFLPSTFFINEKTKVFDIVSPDKKYKVNIYHTKIISPLSLYKYLKDEDYYFVLYDINGEIVFKPSPFYGTSEVAAYDSIEFTYGKDKELLYPGELGYVGFVLK
ncbi:DUF6201 family protein [Leclercia tamurae]|uniref:DUF6201 family protein n=1 Tax=Leclercia tamurae TaxID=2926467 RepID=UPI0021C1EA70|nr:DUF6201 family protein [Leclercia adecarboxylata ATCC 23216 = NBRC 102595]